MGAPIAEEKEIERLSQKKQKMRFADAAVLHAM
jgi:hypothetical protein